MNQFSTKVVDALLSGLSDRQKRVIEGRFGLTDKGLGERQTLEAIGREFGITRERVRQIEASSLKIIAENAKTNPVVQSFVKDAKKELKDQGGVMTRERLIEKLSASYEGITENYIGLLLSALHAFEMQAEDDAYHAFYYLDKESLKKAENFIAAWVKHLKSRKQNVLEGAYEKEFADFTKDKKVTSAVADNILATSKLIHKNSFGDYGLTEWSEVNPRTIRDRIHLVLRKKKEPVHFTEIARLINDAKLDTRTALASTVHNELIKDPRFVLVGRGLYGLAEHGYEPGTASEVIARILKKQGPMKSGDIIQAVQKERPLQAQHHSREPPE
jgi:hypothetical protein